VVRSCFTPDHIDDMIAGAGIDLLAIERFRILRSKSRFLSSVFTKREIARSLVYFNRDSFYAAHFTLKEAVLKVVRCGLGYGTLWRQVEIDHKLRPRISGSLLERAKIQSNEKIHISVACSRNFALSIALKEKEPGSMGGV